MFTNHIKLGDMYINIVIIFNPRIIKSFIVKKNNDLLRNIQKKSWFLFVKRIVITVEVMRRSLK